MRFQYWIKNISIFGVLAIPILVIRFANLSVISLNLTGGNFYPHNKGLYSGTRYTQMGTYKDLVIKQIRIAEPNSADILRREMTEPPMRSLRFENLTGEVLNKALKIYYKHAFGTAPDKQSFDSMRPELVKEYLASGTFECRLGTLGWPHMKLFIARGYIGALEFYVSTNDYGILNKKLIVKNNKIKKLIEKEWKESGIPVRE